MNRRGFVRQAAGYAAAGFGAGPWSKAGAAEKLAPAFAEKILPARAVTGAPKYHFFGYYDKCPWNATGRYLLSMEIGFCDHQPAPTDAVTVGMVDLRAGNPFIAFEPTTAWSWQQGTMLQWLGPKCDREVIYNVTDKDHYGAIIRDVQTKKVRELPRPIYSVSADGAQAVTLDFDRLHRLRPGYGYTALPEKFKDPAVPANAGIYWMDVRSGSNKLIISLEWLVKNKPLDSFQDAHHWVNHLQFNPSGTRFVFLHRWAVPGFPWTTRMYTAKPNGTECRLLVDTGLVSHFDWRDDNTILAWCRTKDKRSRFCLLDVKSTEAQVIGEGVMTSDGHCSYSPDRQWILADTYPDKQRLQTLYLVRVADGKRTNIGRFLLPPELTGPYRCDLHPRWNRDGTQVCIDSTHEGGRQMYVLDVSDVVQA